MKAVNLGVLAGALVLAGTTAPDTVQAQSREPLVRAFDVFSRGAHIGVTLEADDAKKTGAVIETVTPDSPADKAGMKAGDAIVEFDGERVRSVLHLTRLVQETPSGRSVAAVLMRGGQKVTVNVTPDRRSSESDSGFRFLDVPRAARAMPTPPPPPRAPRPPAIAPGFPFEFEGLTRFGSARRLGVTVESIENQLAEYFGVKEGALVKSVLNGSAAQKAGIKAGDVITALNSRKVYDTSDVSRAMERLEEGGEFTVEVVRDKKTLTLKGTIEQAEPRRRTGIRTIL
jgi:serine protease Do